MIRPENLEIYDDVDLKLGIKSSLPDVKSSIALLILLWESNKKPYTLIYSEQKDDKIEISEDLKNNILDYLDKYINDEKFNSEKLFDLINSNRLYTSQLESLIVAFELVWKLGIVRFEDDTKASSSERTGLKRYPKKINYSLNLDVIHGVISGNQNEYIKILLSWIGIDINYDKDYELILLEVLQALSEGSIYKLDNSGEGVIFNQNSIYTKLIEGNDEVDISGDKESKGSLRILKSALSDNMNPYLEYKSGLVSLNPMHSDGLNEYQKRVETFLRLSSVDLSQYSNHLDSKSNKVLIDEEARVKGGANILLYGVPGSGKSYTISKEYCDDESKIERIVFHPDYMNTDFIGQILPTIKEDKTITYEFTPGPFTRIMKKAYEDPENEYYLIIEEINRGNAPAIFGDIFQLLDRKTDGSSSYSIKNYNVADIVYGNDDVPISIPSNLSIIATMNTADQNVFTLDTAFQRRWIMRLIKNDVSKAEHADKEILDTGVTWGEFNTTINEFILASNSSTMSSEDKRLGAYFITEDILDSDNKSIFAEKVIKYLWDDAFKFARNKLFDSNYRSLEKVIDDFSNTNGFNRFDIFTAEVKGQLRNNSNFERTEITDESSEELAKE